MKDINPFSDIQDKGIGQGSTLYGSELMNLQALQVGAGSNVLRSDESGFWMGAEKWANAPFKVDMAGNVYASSLTATGYIAVGGAAGDVNSGATTISGTKITASSITGTQIAAGTITASNIAASTITANEIASNAITSAKINAGAVTTAKLAAGAVTANEISAGAVTASKISVTTLSAINADLGTITAGSITGVTITSSGDGSKIVLNSGNYLGFYNGGVLKGELRGGNNSGIVVNTGSLITYRDEGFYAGEQSSGGITSFFKMYCTDVGAGVIGGVLEAPSSNKIYLTDSSGNTMLSVSTSQTYSANGFLCDAWGSFGGDVDLNGNLIKEVKCIEFSEQSLRPSTNDMLYYRNSSGSYSFRTRMEGGDWSIDQTAV